MKTRTIAASGRYLLLPIADMQGWMPPAEDIQILGIYRNGERCEEYELVLSHTPRMWSCLFLDSYRGETLQLTLEGGDEALLDHIEVSDALKDADTLYREPERPLAHFTPMHGFMNDPNGLYFQNGAYHFFAQLNPYGVGVGNTHWMHAVSRDFVHWEERPYALLPDESGRMYSGGGIVDSENTSGLMQNGISPAFLFYTAAGSKSRMSRGKPFEIAAAVSTDAGETFRKLPQNPIVPHICYMNRDPKVVWEPEGENWVMLIFLDNDRYMLLYSKDLLHWDKGESVMIRGAAECPDIFCLPLDGDETRRKWMLWGATDCYLIGHFEGRRFVSEEAVEGSTHQIQSAYSLFARSPGNYAAQTFTGLPNGRVVQISWIRTRIRTGPFSSCMSVPNALALVSTAAGPRIQTWPIQEVEALREKSYSFKNRGLEELERIPQDVLGEAMDMTFRFTIHPEKLIAVSVRGVLIVYDPKGEQLILPCGAYRVPRDESGEFELRVITDRASVEIYANGGLFYLALATVPDPSNTFVLPISLDAGIGADFEIHKLRSMWSKTTTV